MKDFHEFGFILPAALITLALSGELAVLPMLVPRSFLELVALWGVTTYALLVFCSWVIGEDVSKKKIASVFFLVAISLCAIFIIIALAKYYNLIT